MIIIQIRYKHAMELHRAIWEKKTDLASTLIEQKADLNYRCLKTKNTPIITACIECNEKVALKLLEHEIDLNQKNDYGVTAILASIANDALKVTNVLLEKKVNPNIIYEPTKTIWQKVSPQSLYIVKIKPDDRSFGLGTTSLHVSVFRQLDDISVKLLEKGAEILADATGKTPIDLLTLKTIKKMPKFIKYLKSMIVHEFLESINSETIIASSFCNSIGDLNVLDIIGDFIYG